MNKPAAPAPAQAAPVATPDTNATIDPAAIKIKIPGAAEPNTTPVAEVKPEPAVAQPKPADGAAPPNPMAEAPADGAPVIPTDITGSGKKTDAQFAEERRKAKAAKLEEELGVPELRKNLETTQADLARIKIERDALEAERNRIAEEKAQYEASKKEIEQRLEASKLQYFDEFKATMNPDDDKDFAEANQGFASTLAANLPSRLPDSDGEKRVFPENLMRDPAFNNGAANIMSHYLAARQNGKAEVMDIAVNAMAQLLGVPMKIDPIAAKCEGMLDPADPVFKKIEDAMNAASPHFLRRTTRLQAINSEAPKLIREGLLNRERTIAQNIKSAVKLDADVAAARLRENPSDTAAIIATIVDDNPQLQEFVDAAISKMAPAFARMGKINMPTLGSDDPTEIDNHRREIGNYQNTLAQAMPKAVLGEIAGPIIASLIGQLRSMHQRLGNVALNTNPGPIDGGGSGTPPAPKIPTEI